MTGPLLPTLQVGVFAASLLLAGWNTLLLRRPEPDLEWPPSPAPPRDPRRDLTIISASALYLIAGMTMAALAITAALLQVVAAKGGPGPG